MVRAGVDGGRRRRPSVPLHAGCAQRRLSLSLSLSLSLYLSLFLVGVDDCEASRENGKAAAWLANEPWLSARALLCRRDHQRSLRLSPLSTALPACVCASAAVCVCEFTPRVVIEILENRKKARVSVRAIACTYTGFARREQRGMRGDEGTAAKRAPRHNLIQPDPVYSNDGCLKKCKKIFSYKIS